MLRVTPVVRPQVKTGFRCTQLTFEATLLMFMGPLVQWRFPPWVRLHPADGIWRRGRSKGNKQLLFSRAHMTQEDFFMFKPYFGLYGDASVHLWNEDVRICLQERFLEYKKAPVNTLSVSPLSGLNKERKYAPEAVKVKRQSNTSSLLTRFSVNECLLCKERCREIYYFCQRAASYSKNPEHMPSFGCALTQIQIILAEFQ